MPGTIVEDALSLVFEKLTAAAIFRGESAGQALMTVRGSGSFTADLIDRVMTRSDGQVNDGPSEPVEDLETLFQRYSEEDETSELASVTANPATERAAQVVEEVQRPVMSIAERKATEVADWAATQLSLF